MEQSPHRIVPRELTERERELLLFVLSAPFPGREDALRQAEAVRVRGECICGCSTIDLEVDGRPEGLASYARSRVITAFSYAVPDAPVDVSLHFVNGVLRELEVVWYNPNAGQDMDRIRPSALTLPLSEHWLVPEEPQR